MMMNESIYKFYWQIKHNMAVLKFFHSLRERAREIERERERARDVKKKSAPIGAWK